MYSKRISKLEALSLIWCLSEQLGSHAGYMSHQEVLESIPDDKVVTIFDEGGSLDLEEISHRINKELDEDELEEVPQAMMDELEVFGGISFYVAMDLFNKGNFPNMEYYRSSRGIDNDHNVFYKFIKHINGEPQFKAEKPKKWIVREKDVDSDGFRLYIIGGSKEFNITWKSTLATRFDTKEEAHQWTNPQFEVVEVEE